MKTFAPPCGLLALSFLAFSYLIAIPVKAQTIQIDSTFNSNGEIFPFENFDLISSLTIEGDIHYLETTTAPQFSEPSEYFSSDGNNKTKQPKENYIKLFPNPAGDYVIVYYDIVSDSQPIFLELTDN